MQEETKEVEMSLTEMLEQLMKLGEKQNELMKSEQK